MSYIKFSREQLINLEFSQNREILRSNRAGSYMSTTLCGCNTRKYHGLLICPIRNFHGEKHVLLSSLDETVIQNDAEFNLGIHRYKNGTYEPKGHKYIRSVEFDQISKTTYRVGGVILTKERLLVEKAEQVLVRYTLQNANSPTLLRIKPFLAFRNIHGLSKANMHVNTKFNIVKKGIGLKLYEGYPELYLQTSKDADFVPAPDWYYNIEYLKELNRGYEYLEDLFVPGYFEFTIKKGESVVFAAGLAETKPVSLKQRFTKELKKRGGRITFSHALNQAAEQFIRYQENGVDVIAGFPWYGSITRQTFVALPGLDTALNNERIYSSILDTYLKKLHNGMMPDSIDDKEPTYNSSDTSLWFVWALQQYLKRHSNVKEVYKKYGSALRSILNSIKDSFSSHLITTKEGLIHAHKPNTPLTWMNAIVNGNPVVPREGLAVEVNALWYNAVCFLLELAEHNKDVKIIDQWTELKDRIGKAFIETFWDEQHGYLADVVTEGRQDWSVRPNMVIATAMDYTPLTHEQQKQVLTITQQKLLTSRGLRTLSPDHIRYRGLVEGNHEERELTIHQGAVWPWLIQFFVETYLRINKNAGISYLNHLMESLEEEITEHCIGTISETYNGNPPHHAKGAVSQAWSVAGVLNAMHMIQNFTDK